MTESTVIDVQALIAAGKTQKSRSGGRGKSSAASQLDVLGYDGLQWLVNQSKSNKVSTTEFVNIGSEFFRKENADWTLSKKAESAKTFTKVTVLDIDLILKGEEVVRLSEVISDIASYADKIVGFGEVYIKNEQFACEWPLGEPINVREGDPKASDLAPILAKWSLFEEAMAKFANK